jgi:hypothetical protein
MSRAIGTKDPMKERFPMANASKRMLVLAGIIAFSGMAAGQTPVVSAYPYILVQPDTSYADKDPVILQIVKGRASNSCWAPTYEEVSFAVEISPLTIYPPQYSVTVQYKEIPVPKDRVCPDVYNPVIYGPVFKLGILKEGRYTVIDSGRSVGTFAVTVENKVPLYVIKGKVVDDPYPLKRMSLPIPKVRIEVKKQIATPIVVDQVSRPVPIEQPVCTTFTDSSGNFALKELGRGIYRLYCTHPDFNPATLGLTLSSDTAVAITMTATSAAAAVTGRVTEISVVSDIVSAGIPVEGCTVQVARPAIYITDAGGTASIEPGLSAVTLTTVADKSGMYAVPKIPIAYNGERWRITAIKNGYVTESRLVALYNMGTDTVDFAVQRSFINFNSDTVRGIIFTIATNKSLYTVGEGVTTRYTITNTTADPVTFSPFAMQCEYDMTVASADGTVLFRLSDVTQCLESFAPVEITVQPGQTVLKTFPVYYVPDFTTIASQKTPRLIIAARLRGEKYDETELSVGITVQRATTSALPAVPLHSNLPSISCAPVRNGVVLKLSGPQNVSLTVYSLDGKINRDCSFKKELSAGSHLFPFFSAGPGGVYIVNIAAGHYSKAFKISVHGG